MADYKTIIEHWFMLAGGGGLVLPDGWFGRPNDNLHQLTYVETRPHKLLIELDSLLLLVITDLSNIRVEKSALVLTDFSQCVFDWQEYGSAKPNVSIYHSGEIRMIPPLGTSISGSTLAKIALLSNK